MAHANVLRAFMVLSVIKNAQVPLLMGQVKCVEAMALVVLMANAYAVIALKEEGTKFALPQ